MCNSPSPQYFATEYRIKVLHHIYSANFLPIHCLQSVYVNTTDELFKLIMHECLGKCTAGAAPYPGAIICVVLWLAWPLRGPRGLIWSIKAPEFFTKTYYFFCCFHLCGLNCNPYEVRYWLSRQKTCSNFVSQKSTVPLCTFVVVCNRFITA
jgi:hypothetical protein